MPADVDLARDFPLLLALLFLLVMATLLGAAETSLLRVRKLRIDLMAEEGDRRARRLAGLLADLPGVLNSVLLTVLLVQIGAASIAGLVAQRAFGNLGVTIGSFVLTAVLFVYGEAIPKTYAVRYPQGVALALAWPIWLLAKLLSPLVGVLVKLADLQAPGHGIAGPSVSEEELRAMAAEAEAAGSIEPTDRRLIERAFRLGDRRVGEIVVPRTDVVAVSAAAPVQEALDTAIAAGHRRLPVYEESLDQITGAVRLRDLAGAVAEGRQVTAGDLARPVLVAPETKRVVHLLSEMQERGMHLAVVVDEHGGTAGLATIEDVVEELVGHVSDEGEGDVPEITVRPGGGYLMKGTCDVADLAEVLDAELPEGDWTTAAGLVIGLAGRIPDVGDEFEAAGWRFRVAAATRRRVETIEAQRA